TASVSRRRTAADSSSRNATSDGSPEASSTGISLGPATEGAAGAAGGGGGVASAAVVVVDGVVVAGSTAPVVTACDSGDAFRQPPSNSVKSEINSRGFMRTLLAMNGLGGRSMKV